MTSRNSIPDNLTVLVLDTAMNGCSVGVWRRGSGLLAGQTSPMLRGQAEVLVPMIELVLADADVSYADIDMIAVTRGPGAFTGLRIGLATAKALGLALDVPVCGVSTFESLLQTYSEEDDFQKSKYYGVVIETKRDDYYFQLFDNAEQEASDRLSAPADKILPLIKGREVVFIGDAVARFSSDLNGDLSAQGDAAFVSIALPSIDAIAKVALTKRQEGYTAAPLYIRPPDVSVPKEKAGSVRR